MTTRTQRRHIEGAWVKLFQTLAGASQRTLVDACMELIRLCRIALLWPPWVGVVALLVVASACAFVPRTRRVVQSQRSTCVAAVCAMATQTTEAEFIEFARAHGYVPPYTLGIASKYLENHGVAMMDEQSPAIVITYGNGGYAHALFWNGLRVIDPLPTAPDTVQLHHYRVGYIVPLRPKR